MLSHFRLSVNNIFKILVWNHKDSEFEVGKEASKNPEIALKILGVPAHVVGILMDVTL